MKYVTAMSLILIKPQELRERLRELARNQLCVNQETKASSQLMDFLKQTKTKTTFVL